MRALRTYSSFTFKCGVWDPVDARDEFVLSGLRVFPREVCMSLSDGQSVDLDFV